MRRGRYFLALTGLLATVLAVPASAQGPARIASINMCTDQLLLDLGQREQIVGLSPYARDMRSWAAAKADGLTVLSGTAEEIMVLRPDLVLAGRFTRRATREFIRQKRIPIEEFDAVRSVSEAKTQIVRVAALAGNPARAMQRIAELDAAVARLRAAASTSGLTVLPLARRGWVSGQQSLMTDLLSIAGLTSGAGALGVKSGSFINLERIVSLKPDALVMSRNSDTAEDQGRAMLLHPAIASLFPPERRIIIAESLTVCGGPMLVEAMDQLAAQIRGIKPRDAAGH
jgi:iron complex transport system substrate-binding protein